MGARLSRLRRLVADPHALDAQELQDDTDRLCTHPVARVERGQQVVVTGRLRSVVYTPRQTVPTFSAELYDGSGSIELVWLGRRRIAGLQPGRKVTARGRVGIHDGHLALYNPWYELRAGASG